MQAANVRWDKLARYDEGMYWRVIRFNNKSSLQKNAMFCFEQILEATSQKQQLYSHTATYFPSQKPSK